MHCDGSAARSGGQYVRAGYGVVLQWRGVKKCLFGSLGPGISAQKAELLAVIRGFEAIKKKKNQRIAVYGDNQYVIFCAGKIWKGKVHEEEWRTLRKLEKEHLEVIYNWIPRELNEEADKLAGKVHRNA